MNLGLVWIKPIKEGLEEAGLQVMCIAIGKVTTQQASLNERGEY